MRSFNVRRKYRNRVVKITTPIIRPIYFTRKYVNRKYESSGNVVVAVVWLPNYETFAHVLNYEIIARLVTIVVFFFRNPFGE